MQLREASTAHNLPLGYRWFQLYSSVKASLGPVRERGKYLGREVRAIISQEASFYSVELEDSDR